MGTTSAPPARHTVHFGKDRPERLMAAHDLGQGLFERILVDGPLNRKAIGIL